MYPALPRQMSGQCNLAVAARAKAANGKLEGEVPHPELRFPALYFAVGERPGAAHLRRMQQPSQRGRCNFMGHSQYGNAFYAIVRGPGLATVDASLDQDLRGHRAAAPPPQRSRCNWWFERSGDSRSRSYFEAIARLFGLAASTDERFSTNGSGATWRANPTASRSSANA